MTEPDTEQKSAKRKRLGRWLAEGLLFLLLLYLVHLWQTRNTVAGGAPPLEASLLTGGYYALDQRAGKPKLVYFWATWCPICNLTSGNVSALSEDYEVITIVMQSGEAGAVRQHLTDNGLRFPVIQDPQGDLARSWGVGGVPAFFILDAENQIRFVSIGYTSKPGLIARLWLAGV